MLPSLAWLPPLSVLVSGLTSGSSGHFAFQETRAVAVHPRGFVDQSGQVGRVDVVHGLLPLVPFGRFAESTGFPEDHGRRTPLLARPAPVDVRRLAAMRQIQ